mgnify:CR=1 FL=1
MIGGDRSGLDLTSLWGYQRMLLCPGMKQKMKSIAELVASHSTHRKINFICTQITYTC